MRFFLLSSVRLCAYILRIIQGVYWIFAFGWKSICVSRIDVLLKASKLIVAGLATISLAVAWVVIVIVFISLTLAIARNPSLTKQLFTYALLCFALTYAIALFCLIMAFLILFG